MDFIDNPCVDFCLKAALGALLWHLFYPWSGTAASHSSRDGQPPRSSRPTEHTSPSECKQDPPSSLKDIHPATPNPFPSTKHLKPSPSLPTIRPPRTRTESDVVKSMKTHLRRQAETAMEKGYAVDMEAISARLQELARFARWELQQDAGVMSADAGGSYMKVKTMKDLVWVKRTTTTNPPADEPSGLCGVEI